MIIIIAELISCKNKAPRAGHAIRKGLLNYYYVYSFMVNCPMRLFRLSDCSESSWDTALDS